MPEAVVGKVEPVRPKEHNASRSYIEEMTRRRQLPPQVATDIPRLDPIRTFERESPQNLADLTAWLTLPVDERQKRLSRFVESTYEVADAPGKPGDTIAERATKRLRRWRLLSFVIWMETDPAKDPKVQSRSIADAAYSGLYAPREKK